MASLERLPSGRWRVRWRQGGRGSAWSKSPAIDTKAEALGVLARVEADLAATRSPRRGIAESMSVLAAAWIAHKVTAGRDPDHTRREGERLRALLRRYGWAELVELSPAQVDQARAMTEDAEGAPLRWSPRAGALLAACLRWAAERRGASIDTRTIVALRPGPPRRTPARALVDAAEVQRWHTVAASISPDCAALVHCLTRYGWRPITAARLVVADLDTGRRVIRVPVKGGDVIEHPIMPDTATRLAALAADRLATDPLFLDPRTGRAFAISGAYTIPQWWRDHLGAHSYDAKRWAISHLLRVAPPHEVARITGHRTPSVLFRYAVTTEERSRAVLSKAWAHRGHTGKPRRARKPRANVANTSNHNETTQPPPAIDGANRI
jgi:hypothetical protein